MYKYLFIYSYKVAALVGLTRKSQSASQLAGGKKSRTSFQRSEEVGAAADLRNKVMIRQPSTGSTDGSIGSMSSESSLV